MARKVGDLYAELSIRGTGKSFGELDKFGKKLKDTDKQGVKVTGTFKKMEGSLGGVGKALEKIARLAKLEDSFKNVLNESEEVQAFFNQLQIVTERLANGIIQLLTPALDGATFLLSKLGGGAELSSQGIKKLEDRMKNLNQLMSRMKDADDIKEVLQALWFSDPASVLPNSGFTAKVDPGTKIDMSDPGLPGKKAGGITDAQARRAMGRKLLGLKPERVTPRKHPRQMTDEELEAEAVMLGDAAEAAGRQQTRQRGPEPKLLDGETRHRSGLREDIEVRKATIEAEKELRRQTKLLEKMEKKLGPARAG